MAEFTGDTPSASRGSLPPEARRASLLDLEPKLAAERMLKDWEDSDPPLKHLLAQWKANRARSRGYTGVQVIKKQDEMRVHIPKGATPSYLMMNKAARLKRRVRAVLFADKPEPECTPASGDDRDLDRAEFATRVLQDFSGESRLNYPLIAGDAFDLGSEHGSGFLRFWVDPYGGGYRPRQILAHPRAIAEAQATLNPETGAAGAPEDMVPRYVLPDGSLADRPQAGVEMQWLPGLRYELLTGRHVRFIPATARDIWSAEGVMIGALVSFGELKTMFPELGALDDQKLTELAGYRPSNAKDLLPIGCKDYGLTSGAATDDTLIFVLSRYHAQCHDYPKGFYGIVLGDGALIKRQTWYDEEHQQPLDIPVTQYKQYQEEGHGYGWGLMEGLGPGNEQRARMIATMDEHLDRFAHRKTFLPMHSVLNPEQLQSESGTVLSVNMGGEPRYEEVPDFPAMVEKMHAQTSAEMDDESGLQQAGQAVNVPSVTSGAHARAVVEQVGVGMAELRHNTERALVRGWKIMLQLIRAYFTVPQQLQYTGEDGAYTQQEWTGADLGGTTDVRIARGSFTQLPPDAKVQQLAGYVQMQLLGLEDAQHAAFGNLRSTFGLQDNPHRQRVRGQTARWRKGPPPDWVPPDRQLDPATGQATDVPDPVAGAIFAPVVADEEPDVARLRLYELGRAVASRRYQALPQAWRAALDAEYLRMRRAAGIQTVAEQQQAQEQQAQQQAQAQEQQAAAQQQVEQQKAQIDAAKLDFERQKLALEAQRIPEAPPQPQGPDIVALAEALKSPPAPVTIVPAKYPKIVHVRDEQGRLVESVPVFEDGAP